MAFNPFTSFRKYQKFWMATILLLCMVTFVLCTGVGGDLSDRLLGWFRGREGSPLAVVNGRKLYTKDFNDLKEQRNIANEFMKKAVEASIKNLSVDMNDQKMTADQRKKLLPYLAKAKADLEQRLAKPRYFGTGVKLEDLVDFKIWQGQADRLGVNLLPENVLSLLSAEVIGDLSKFSLEQMYGIIRELRMIIRTPNQALVVNALKEEFRVRIAQVALEFSDRNNMVRKEKLKFQSDLNPEVRIALSPAMLWDSFKANRSTFDVAMVPVEVDAFTKDIQQPTEAELESLFKSHYKERYDPSAPMPGFSIPTSTKVEYVMGDPTSPKYKQWSHAAIILEATPPGWVPSSPLSTLAAYAGGPLAQRVLLQDQYEKIRAERSLRDQYLSAAWNHANIYEVLANKLASAYPEAAASWIAGYAQPSNFATAQFGFTAFGSARHPKELAAELAVEAKERAPVYATVVLAGLAGNGLPALATLESLDKEKFLSLDMVKKSVTEFRERRLAEAWVTTNMMALRKLLDANVGKKANFLRELDRNVAKMGLELKATAKSYNQFDIDKAPELQPLVKEFDKEYRLVNFYEGRDLTPENALKEGDFYRLFFDGTESFSAAGSTYKAKPWPPRVTPKKTLAGNPFLGGTDPTKPPPPIELFDKAEKPILFWKTEDNPGKVPTALAQVRDRVEHAWKFLKARESKALPKAKEIADLMQKSEEGFGPVLQFEALKLGKQVIDLKGLAAMYAKDQFQPAFPNLPKAFEPGLRDYTPYQVPKDTFTYPRDDMAKELLSLQDLKKAIEIGDPKLDEYNKALYEVGAKNGRVVQILTNKPHSAFYVACVTFSPGPSLSEFRSVVKYAFPTDTFKGGRFMDSFFDRAFDEAGKAYQKSLMTQLWEQTGTSILADTDARKSFDANETS